MSNKAHNRPSTTNKQLKQARADVQAAQQQAIQMRQLYDAVVAEKQHLQMEIARRDMLLAAIVATADPDTGEFQVSQEAIDQVEAGFFLGLDISNLEEGGMIVSLVYDEDFEEEEDEEEEDEGDEEE